MAIKSPAGLLQRWGAEIDSKVKLLAFREDKQKRKKMKEEERRGERKGGVWQRRGEGKNLPKCRFSQASPPRHYSLRLFSSFRSPPLGESFH